MDLSSLTETDLYAILSILSSGYNDSAALIILEELVARKPKEELEFGNLWKFKDSVNSGQSWRNYIRYPDYITPKLSDSACDIADPKVVAICRLFYN